jgi:hypothetical protein
MKLILTLVLSLVPILAEAKAKEVPLPRPHPIRVTQIAAIPVAQVVNPDPFKVNPQPAPAPQPTPVIVTTPVPPPPTLQSEILQWVWAAIGALFTAILGKFAIKPPAIPGVATKIDASHPDIRNLVDQALIKAIETGVPGGLVRTGLGAIPVVGGAAGLAEPLIRKIVLAELRKRTASGEIDITPDEPALSGGIHANPEVDTGFTPWSGLPQDIFHKIEGIVAKKVEERIAERLSGLGKA